MRLSGRGWADAYLYVLLASALGASGVAVLRLHPGAGLASFVTLCVLAAAAELYPLIVRGAASSLIATILWVAFLSLGWAGAVLAALVGAVLGQVALRRAPRVIAFNAAQYILSAAVGAHAARLGHTSPVSIAAVALFLAGYYLTSNFLSYGYLLVRGDGIGRRHLQAVAAVEAPSLGLSLMAGLALLALHAGGDRVDPLGLAFFFLPFIGLGYVLRQSQDARLFQRQTLSLVNVLTAQPAGVLEDALRAMAGEICRDGAADAAALLKVSGPPRVLATSEHPNRKFEQRARAVGRLARMRGGEVQIRRIRPGEELQSWYAATGPEKAVAVVIGRRHPYAYFGQMRRLVRTAAGVLAALLEREQSLRRRQEAVVTAERARLARRIHDTLAQDLVALGVEIGAAERAVAQESVRDLLLHARAEARQALGRVREAIVALEPVGEHTDLFGVLQGLQAEYRGRGSELEIKVEEDLPELVGEVAQALVYGAVEGVRNAFKHSGGAVALRIAAEGQQVVLRVTDGGPAVQDGEPHGTGLGLRLLEQAVRRCGGQLELRHLPGGSEFELRVPLTEGAGS